MIQQKTAHQFILNSSKFSDSLLNIRFLSDYGNSVLLRTIGGQLDLSASVFAQLEKYGLIYW